MNPQPTKQSIGWQVAMIFIAFFVGMFGTYVAWGSELTKRVTALEISNGAVLAKLDAIQDRQRENQETTLQALRRLENKP